MIEDIDCYFKPASIADHQVVCWVATCIIRILKLLSRNSRISEILELPRKRDT